MKFKILPLLACFTILSAVVLPKLRADEVILQYFSTEWTEITKRLPEVAEAGYTALWLPPPQKATSTLSVGFDTFDRFDLGDKSTNGGRTKYGTRSELEELISTAHRLGLRVYFDNVMAHNSGTLTNAIPGQLFSEVPSTDALPTPPGFVPEDFHIYKDADGNWAKYDTITNYADEWQVLYNNPFESDIAFEPTTNLNFNPVDDTAAQTHPKNTTVIRHPDNLDYYLDTDLPLGIDNNGLPLYTFANKEPFLDVGLDGTADTGDTGEGDGLFTFTDANSNGQHDAGEASEPFTDTGLFPKDPNRQTITYGAGDNIYNMGNPVAESVNEMIIRAGRWFMDQTHSDGLRLDAVKHVQAEFFGTQSGVTQNSSSLGYLGGIQSQYNLSGGFADWTNHRDSLFDHTSPRDDAFFYAEHIVDVVPHPDAYYDAGMRIANRVFQDIVANYLDGTWGYGDINLPGHLAYGSTNPDLNDGANYLTYYGAEGINKGMMFIASHDDSFIWDGDSPADRDTMGHKPAAYALMLTRAGVPIVYTDGYNYSTDFSREVGGPYDVYDNLGKFFPFHANTPFLGQFNPYLTNYLNINQHFARGSQKAIHASFDLSSYERLDRQDAPAATDGEAAILLFLMARFGATTQATNSVVTSFPIGARLRNYNPEATEPWVRVSATGTLQTSTGSALTLDGGESYAFSWYIPETPEVWQANNAFEADVPPIQILQGGVEASTISHVRSDPNAVVHTHATIDDTLWGTADPLDFTKKYHPPFTSGGDPNFNPHNLTGDTAGDYKYTVEIPRITDGSDLTFRVRSDGSAGNILLKLDGGVDINSQLGIGGHANGDDRDNPPGLATDTYLGYEEMQFVRRSNEKFAAEDVNRNIVGSPNAESWQCTIGSAGISPVNGTPAAGQNPSANAVTWIWHNPIFDNQQTSPQIQFFPAPQDAVNQPVNIWAKVGYATMAHKAYIYYTTDGTTPNGSGGTGKETTQVVEMNWVANGNPGEANPDGLAPDWWRGILPALPSGTNLRYKLGFSKDDAWSIFPWSDDDITLKTRMETVFEITKFDATTATVYPHNDNSDVSTGLDEGFHILRAKSFVNRGNGSQIYSYEKQTFYYDAVAPTGAIAQPENDGDTMVRGGSNIWLMKFTSDATVDEVQIQIIDQDDTNDDTATGETNGNGTGAWANATFINYDAEGQKVWQLNYKNIPDLGTATIRARFKEPSSSDDNALTDAAGWFATVERDVITGQLPYFAIGVPNENDQVFDGYVFRVNYSKGLGADVNDLSIYIASTVSGDPIGEVLQDRSNYTIDTTSDVNNNILLYSLPTLFHADPAFLHHIRVTHSNATWPQEDTVNVRGDQLFFDIEFPNEGDQIIAPYDLKIKYPKALGTDASKFSLYIASTVSGDPTGEVLQPQSYTFDTVPGDHNKLIFTLPQLLHDDPAFLHHIRVVYDDGSLNLEDSVNVRGESVQFNINYPQEGDQVVTPYNLQLEFDEALGITPADFSIYIASTVSGDPTGEVLQPQSYTFDTSPAGTDILLYSLPTLSHANPSFLHHIRVVYNNGSNTYEDTVNVHGVGSDPNADFDGDGLPNGWEAENGLDASDDGTTNIDNGPNGDSDGDGMTNAQEYLLGANPTLNDLHTFTPCIEPCPGCHYAVQFPVKAGRRYNIEYSDDLQTWADASWTWDITTDDPEWKFYDNGGLTTPNPDPATGLVSKRFYRFRVTWTP